MSRQTVYSIFGTREELVSQAVTDRLTHLVGAFEDAVASAACLVELFVEIMVEARRQILGDPLLRFLTLSGSSNDSTRARRPGPQYWRRARPAVDRFPSWTPGRRSPTSVCTPGRCSA